MKAEKNSLQMITSAVILLTLAVLPPHLPATEFAPVSVPTNITTSSTTQTSMEILEPDFFELSIDYTWSHTLYFNGNGTMIGRLVMMTDIPTFTIGGSSSFTDGTIATQTFTLRFQGIWHLYGACNFIGDPDVYTGEAYHMDYGTMTFGLTEDTGDGAYWRLITGDLPAASIFPPDMGGGIYVGGRFELCTGAASSRLNNDLEFNNFVGYDFGYASSHQALSKTECTSPYPAFSFISNHGSTYIYRNDEETYSRNCALVLYSGKNQEVESK